MIASFDKVYLELCKSIDSPRSLACSLLYSHREFEQLVSLTFDPLHYCSDLQDRGFVIETLRNDYLCTEMVSKVKFFDLGHDYDPKAVAIADFRNSELKCKETNLRFRESRIRGFPPRVAPVLYSAQRKISSLLFDGKEPFSLDTLFNEVQFGPGATESLSNSEAYTDRKITNLSISPYAVKYLNLDLHTSKIWNEACLADNVMEIAYQDCNKVITVPKNAKRDRTIGIEPTYMMFYQKSIGNYLRKRLSSRGVDLKDQSRNQEYARLGSLNNDLATVDLKAASDSISVELIYELFPVDFACILDDLRSKKYKLDDEVHTYEKFSSMGNGFTFEVESLIFWAISSSCVDELRLSDRRVSVYGDDIIIPSDALPLLKEVLSFCGFDLNEKKTHAYSPFRESCGKHYFFGSDVSPIYQKENPCVLEEAYRLANRIRRLSVARMAGAGSDRVLQQSWLASVELVRHLERELKLQFEVPINSELDGGLALPLEEMSGYSYLRLKKGDRIYIKKVRHRYSPISCSWGFLCLVEKRKEVARRSSEYGYVLRSSYYRPESPTTASRREGRRSFATVRFGETVIRDLRWIG